MQRKAFMPPFVFRGLKSNGFQQFGPEEDLSDKEDLQQIRLEIEKAKLRLTTHPTAMINLDLKGVGKWNYEDLFKSIEKPIEAALADANLEPSEVDEIVLVGVENNSSVDLCVLKNYFQIQIDNIVNTYPGIAQSFSKPPNFGVDPELAVVVGASVQAGVIGGGWPLQRSI
ncbi:unnamed protein product [Strongylus vulgaris]|uniref:Uncharacterized protein n=1 Tax=Strongylus vulgaris TaxID=40348 RepID=A0A3P7IEE7_STRVU|nr:unnamed protein product [Strongylus vulgaris]